MDNWSIYGTAADLLDGIWAQISNTNDSTFSGSLTTDPDGISTGQVWSILAGTGGTKSILRYALPTTQSTVGIAFRLWMPELPSGSNTVMVTFRDGSNAIIGNIGVDTTGRIYCGNTEDAVAPGLATSASPVITAAAWYHVEVKLVYGASGTMTVKVEGAQVLNYTGTFTASGG
jgi:hypothetical protein